MKLFKYLTYPKCSTLLSNGFNHIQAQFIPLFSSLLSLRSR